MSALAHCFTSFLGMLVSIVLCIAHAERDNDEYLAIAGSTALLCAIGFGISWNQARGEEPS